MTISSSPGTAQEWVLHVDLDQFIAAVEMLRRPELVGRPVVVGGRGDPTERGVVATASYAAREHGVGSGMPLRIAVRKIPDAVFLPVDKPAYDEASARVMDTLRALEWGGAPVVVEVLGWDEAFLGPGAGHGDLGDPRVFAQHIRASVHAATDLTCGVGIGDNKLRAKIATAFGKKGEGDGSVAVHEGNRAREWPAPRLVHRRALRSGEGDTRRREVPEDVEQAVRRRLESRAGGV